MSAQGEASGPASSVVGCDVPGRTDVAVASLLTIVSGLFFGLHRSRWLDDWDSVQFALALERLSLTEHRPHPPGYFAYVFMARGIDVLADDPQLSLTTLSIVAGALTIGLLYLTGRVVRDRTTGLVAAGMLFATPAFTKGSVVAMSDVVVLPFFFGALLLGVLARRALVAGPRPRALLLLVATGGLAAWGAGVRPQWSLHLALLLLGLAIWCRAPRAWLGLGLGGALGLGAWLLPALRELEMGVGGYLRSGAQQYGAHPSTRAKLSADHLGEYLASWVLEWELVFALFASASLLLLVLGAARRRAPWTRAVGIWSIGALVLALLGVAEALWLHPLAFRRALLPAAPFVALLLAIPYGLFHAGLRGAGARAAMAGACGAMLVLGIAGAQARARQLDRSRPPPVDAARFVAEQLEGERVLVVAGMSFRHFQHYLPPHADLQWRDSFAWGPSLDRGDYSVLVTDWPLDGLEPSRSVRFERSPLLYAKHHRVTLYTYELADLRFVLDEGIFYRERWGFWTTDEARGWARADARGSGRLALSVHSAFGTQRTLELSVGDASEPVATAQVGGERQTLEASLPLGRQWQPVTLFTAQGCESGKARGVSGDQRCLAFAIHEAKVGAEYYALGDTLHFDANRVVREQLRQGWSAPEDWGVWSDEGSAVLALVLAEPVSDEVLRLELEARLLVLAGEPAPPTLEVLANGATIGRWTPDDGSFHELRWALPGSLIPKSGRLELVLRVTPMRTPAELDLGQDLRTLGVGLRSVRVSPKDADEPAAPP
ncbi:glycosyltransferase family protein [Paraliomyxa miuraensis]|uniref:hypothetical protein n=1 Tax=Paraliomyxa miuraensis TaxID=376150 RepID=UPI002256F15A|nr:hypothetical protein [Paraliomyxa miuraensis]MCX4239338.1 glycosyltransferase family 39 protein [Paraliomyxa miuraensis]